MAKTKKFSIRYFSPKMEIPLCGHATLAAARVMLERLSDKRITFVNREQVELVVSRSGKMLVMEFPVFETASADASPQMLAALGIEFVSGCVYNEETKILLLEIESCQTLEELSPDFEALVRSSNSINGVLVTSVSNKEDYDYCSRYFWPWSGTNEDPVTGGIQTFLASYWGEKLKKKRMRTIQLSERTGWMEVELTRTPDAQEKVLIHGQAFIFLSGEICID